MSRRLAQPWLALVALTYLMVAPLPAQETRDLEAEIESAQGRERMVLITTLLSEIAYDDPERAVALGHEAMEALRETPNAEWEVMITCGLCRAHWGANDFDSALAVGRQCLEQAESLEAIEWQAWGELECLSKAFAQTDQLGLAVVHGQRAVELYESIDDPSGLSSALSLTGVLLADLGDTAAALELQQRALDLSRSQGDRQGEAVALLRIGSLHSERRDFELALDYAQRSYEAFVEVEYENGAAAALQNLGVCHAELGQTERALELLQESLAIKRRLGQPRAVAIRLLNIGKAQSELDLWDEARSSIEQAVDQFRDLGSGQLEALSGIELARVQRHQGEIDDAIATLRRSIALAEEIEIEHRVLEAFPLLAQIEEERGNPSAALAALRRHDEIKSAFLSKSHDKRIAEMEVRYRAEEQAREIETLRARQEQQALLVERRRTESIALIVGFALLLLILALLFNRYRLRAAAARMAESLESERAVSAKLREIDRLKDDFLANTSHELRTPLQGIVGLTESLLDGADGELSAPARRDLGLILDSGSRLSALVADILDASKLDRQGLELDRAAVDLRSLVDVVLTLSRPLVGERPIVLANAVPHELPAALADADRVQQVLHNLVGNALEFTERGEVRVDAAVDGEGDDAVLAVRVRDTGPGIPEALREKIFEPFEQADASTERAHGGTGLGLSISRQLVRLHGGELRVDPTAAHGATLVFTLPLAEGTAEIVPGSRSGNERLVEPARPAPTSTPLSRNEAPRRRGPDQAVLLVVDDEPVNLHVLHNHLTLAGHHVLTASGGAEALEILAGEAVDLILVDVMMPHMSGYELCRRVRESHGREELPILFVSAKNRSSDRVAAFELHANDYLAKPIAKQELLQRVETHLELLASHRSQQEEIKRLEGLLTICSACKKIRDDEGQWDEIESYVRRNSEADFTHGLCPSCFEEMSAEIASSRRRRRV